MSLDEFILDKLVQPCCDLVYNLTNVSCFGQAKVLYMASATSFVACGILGYSAPFTVGFVVFCCFMMAVSAHLDQKMHNPRFMNPRRRPVYGFMRSFCLAISVLSMSMSIMIHDPHIQKIISDFTFVAGLYAVACSPKPRKPIEIFQPALKLATAGVK